MNHSKPQWWAPVRTGLVMDSDAKHYRKMKNAIWLFLYLVLAANRQSGILIRKISTISSDMGISRDMVMRWLSTLRKEGYIDTASTGRYLVIRISLWKTLSDAGNMPRQMRQRSDFRSWKNPTSQTTSNEQNTIYLSHKSADSNHPNDRPITRDILNNDIDERRSENLKSPTKEKLLAFEIANAFDDLPGLPLYLSCAYKYPEPFLRELMGKVLNTPSSQIKKSRGAFFNYLVRKYGEGNEKHEMK